MTTTKAICTRLLGALLGMAGIHLLSAADLRAQTSPPSPCHAFFEATQWKGTFTLQGTGSGSLADGGTYSINETVTAGPFLSSGNIPGIWGGPLNETIHIDDMETHPDGTFTHVTDDETVTTGPIGKAAGLPGAGLRVEAAACTGFEFDFDSSFNATITTQNGTVTTPQVFGFVGVQQSGSILLTSGAIQGPLPANGLLLTGSASVSYLSLVLGDPGTWTLSWTLNPIFDVDLWVTIPTYQSWRPTGGQSETDTGLDNSGQPNLLQIQALLVDKTTKQPVDFVPDNVNFSLVQFSSEPGVSMNWPVKNALSTPDLTFDKNQPKNAKFTISPDGTVADIAPTIPSNVLPTTIYLSPHDWGGWATLNVTATVGGLPIEGHLVSPAPPGGSTITDILLPQRQPGSHIADVWKSAHNISLTTPDTDDSETDPGGKPGCVGDGFTLYEEYRGFMENRKHIEGDPSSKDFFIVNDIGADSEPGIFLFTGTTGLTVHKDLRDDEAQTSPRPELEVTGVSDTPQGIIINVENVAGRPRMNFNVNEAQLETPQYGVLLRTCSNVYLPSREVPNTLDAIFSGDGGETIYQNQSTTADPAHPDHAHPAIDDFICIQPPDSPGTINPTDTHNGTITRTDAVRQYDIAVAHELSHSIGVSHHGDRLDEGTTKFNLLFKEDPQNTSGKAMFLDDSTRVTLLDEKTSADQAPLMEQSLLQQAAQCLSYINSPTGIPPSLVAECTYTFVKLLNPFTDDIDTNIPFKFTVGLPQGKHSGDDQCWMRYPFANIYPKIGDPTTYYLIPPGTEPLGATLCFSPTGTGVNASTHIPQSRFGDARSGRGACHSWVCVNDVYPTKAERP
jgi:hypothetical protein